MSATHLYIFHLEHGASRKFGGGNFGPYSVLSYYRLGQAYPRTRLRGHVQDKRKVRPWHSRFFQIVNFNQFVNQTLTFVDQATATQALNQSVSQELLFNQAVTTVFLNNVSQTLVFNQTVSAAGSTFNQTVNQTLVFNQTAVGDNVKDVFQTLVFNQTATAQVIHNLSQTLIFFDVATLNHDSNLLTGDALNFLDSASVFNVQSESVSQTLTFVDAATEVEVYTREVAQTLTFTDQAQAAKQEAVNQTLVFNQDAQFDLDKFRSVSQTLTFNQTVTLNVDYVRSVSQTLTFIEGRFLDTGLVDGNGQPVFEFIPAAQAVVVDDANCFILLKVSSRTIVLPCPIFGDSEALSAEMVLDRGNDGTVYTYVKRSELRVLVYSFELTTDKARELRDFILQYQSSIMILQNFKGQIFKGNLTNNPFEFVATGRWATCSEKIEITLEFEGLKIN